MVEKIDLNKDITKTLESMEDWYRAVIFDKNVNILSKKNLDKPDEKELRYEIKIYMKCVFS